ncbi:small heat shock protein HSP20, putative [Plasmodium chabaudi chabaudi]|uniref:Small heat shock protein HSP20, putative n=2 Tax=Plasmodium chabaudi TaxID=5825 RepID=A0A077TMX5_PLACU|nr:small heat shock protein HSP20, putative [Plasmodium chabaudi chabaudi]SCM05524.1 small heat shock protein HSP20, putative [Plasmodium chabaudi adami]SCM01007.1 small heat shock protein HSP20, putative [Plasmodium chabaudi chabaudi]SCM02552.1 small heat shock protein HSP20, putative [Plasmodium chabaudi chabaudi]SCM09492.1 small heat shock protein HSP20, putative [Plasmodium chabaudi adami]VTZ68104.1 small heat shock protein HSP20, putative [Plasmodium chabaudi chabaudi]|eukprot:XP_016653648.1 small heat shock protein HSP20, putative [Plasmodium chabaudi chabaudi]
MKCLCAGCGDKGEIKITPDNRLTIKEKQSVPQNKNTLVNPNTVLEIMPDKTLKKQITFRPKVDIMYDSESCHAILVLDIPGFKIDDIDVEIGEGMLTIAGPRSQTELFETYGDNLILHAKEREVGYFKRIFKLPHNILDDTAHAVYKNGILEIKMECKQFSYMHKVEINEA